MRTLFLPPLLLLAPLLLAPPANLWGGAAEALSVVRLEAPRTAARGEPLLLRCTFDLEDGPLYTVKWYKDSREFFRFSPQERPQLRVFTTEGVDLDEHASNATHVRLRSVTHASAGKYSCEVTEDAPSFLALIDLAEVHVVEIDVNAGPPKLEGVHARYRLNEEVTAVCRGPWSRPPAQLTLHLNGHYVNSSSLVRHLPPEERADGLLRPAVKLRARAVAGPDGRLRLRCTAALADAYHMVDEKNAMLVRGRGSTPTATEPSAPLGAADDFPPPTVPEPVLEVASGATLTPPVLPMVLAPALAPPLLLLLPWLLESLLGG
ncbi:hypothetical protein R5R35_000699 [Gryllus longicercus]